MHLYAKAINEVKTDDPLKVRQQLLATKNYPGASGVFAINPQGGVARQPSLFIARDNKIQALEEWRFTGARPSLGYNLLLS